MITVTGVAMRDGWWTAVIVVVIIGAIWMNATRNNDPGSAATPRTTSFAAAATPRTTSFAADQSAYCTNKASQPVCGRVLDRIFIPANRTYGGERDVLVLRVVDSFGTITDWRVSERCYAEAKLNQEAPANCW